MSGGKPINVNNLPQQNIRPIRPDAEIYNVKPFLGMKKLHEETRDATKSVNALAEADEERRCKVLNQLL